MMDLEKYFLKWEPHLLKRIECEDKGLAKLVHSLACKMIDLGDRTSNREIFNEAYNQYDEICSKFLKEKPIAEIIEALINYAVSLDRIERKINKRKLALYGCEIDEPPKNEPMSEDEKLEAYFQTPEFRTQYRNMVDKFIQKPTRWGALEVHYFGRKIGAIWPDEVKEKLLKILDGEARSELKKRLKKVKSEADKFFEERAKIEFWQRAFHYVQSKVKAGKTRRNAKFNFYELNKDDEYLKTLKKPLKDFESFRQAYIREVDQVIKKSRNII